MGEPSYQPQPVLFVLTLACSCALLTGCPSGGGPDPWGVFEIFVETDGVAAPVYRWEPDIGITRFVLWGDHRCYDAENNPVEGLENGDDVAALEAAGGKCSRSALWSLEAPPDPDHARFHSAMFSGPLVHGVAPEGELTEGGTGHPVRPEDLCYLQIFRAYDQGNETDGYFDRWQGDLYFSGISAGPL